jgi:hypothetical protein
MSGTSVDTWSFGKAAQIPREKKGEWKQIDDPAIRQNITKAMSLAKKWLSNPKWNMAAYKACKDWNGIYGRMNGQSIDETLFSNHNPQLANELVNNALVFQSLGPSGEADSLGVKPYKIAVFGSTFESNSRWTFRPIPIPIDMGKAIVHELMHHYTRWQHQQPDPWSNKFDPMYAITSAVLSANGYSDFRYTEGSW